MSDTTNYLHVCENNRLCDSCGWQGCDCQLVAKHNDTTAICYCCPKCGEIVTTSIITFSANPEAYTHFNLDFVDKIDDIITGYGFEKSSERNGKRVYILYGQEAFSLMYDENDKTVIIFGSQGIPICTLYTVVKEWQLRYLISNNLYLLPYIKTS